MGIARAGSDRPADPATFAAAAALCLLMTVSGCVAPALRAIRLDP